MLAQGRGRWVVSQKPKLILGSLKVSGKLPTYPSPKPIFCPKRGVSVTVGLGEGQVGSFPGSIQVSGKLNLFSSILDRRKVTNKREKKIKTSRRIPMTRETLLQSRGSDFLHQMKKSLMKRIKASRKRKKLRVNLKPLFLFSACAASFAQMTLVKYSHVMFEGWFLWLFVV